MVPAAAPERSKENLGCLGKPRLATACWLPKGRHPSSLVGQAEEPLHLQDLAPRHVQGFWRAPVLQDTDEELGWAEPVLPRIPALHHSH